MKYDKPWLSVDKQLALAESRGLVIPDRDRAARWLKHISYYRLSGYFLPFKNGERFRDGTSFNDVAGLYIFDRKLRLILLDAIERIEVALRTHLTHRLSEQYGPFGYADPNTFGKGLDHAAYMTEIREAEHGCSETFVAHFRKKYTSEEHLPIWMATELLSFGCISRMYAEASPGIKRSFADRLGVADKVVRSWMHSLSYVRNVCAHHSRLWNRALAIKPLMPNKCRSWPYIVPQTERLYSVLVITRHCLQRIAPDCKWRHRLFELIDAHPNVPLEAMQIPKEWRTHLPWTGNT